VEVDVLTHDRHILIFNFEISAIPLRFGLILHSLAQNGPLCQHRCGCRLLEGAMEHLTVLIKPDHRARLPPDWLKRLNRLLPNLLICNRCVFGKFFIYNLIIVDLVISYRDQWNEIILVLLSGLDWVVIDRGPLVDVDIAQIQRPRVSGAIICQRVLMVVCHQVAHRAPDDLTGRFPI